MSSTEKEEAEKPSADLRDICVCMAGEKAPCPDYPSRTAEDWRKLLYAEKVEAGTATIDDHCDVLIDAIERDDPYRPPFTVEYVEQVRQLAKPRKSAAGPSSSVRFGVGL